MTCKQVLHTQKKIKKKAYYFHYIFRYELIDILRNNNFNTPEIRISDVYVSNKRAKQTQRRILKGFNINTVETAIRESLANEKGEKKDFFKVVAKAIGNKDRSKYYDLLNYLLD